MPVGNRIFSIIHAAGDADFSANTYSQVYCSAGGAIIINGVSVTMTAGSKLDIMVKSISGAAYVLGDKKDVFTGSVNLHG